MKTVRRVCQLLLIVLFALSCDRKLQGEGPVKEEKKILGDFKIVEISGNFKVFLMYGDDNSAVLKMNENLLENTRVKTRRGKLKIEAKNPVEGFDTYEIYITAKDLNEINLSDAVQLTVPRPFITDNIYIHTKGSSKFIGEFVSKTAMFKVRDRSEIQIRGQARTLDVNAENYADIDAGGFTVSEADFDIRDNANVVLKADKKLKGAAGGNAVLKYMGNPDKDYKTNDRAEVSKKQ